MPQQAIRQFGERYANWTYKTLADDQLALAATSVDSARLRSSRPLAATRADKTLARTGL